MLPLVLAVVVVSGSLWAGCGSTTLPLRDQVAIYERHLSDNPHDIRAFVNVADLYRRQGDMFNVLRTAERLVRNNPESVQAAYEAARLAAWTGRSEERLRYIGRLIAIAPEDWRGYYLRADVNASEGKLEAALTDLDLALARRPAQIELIVQKTRYLTEAERYAEALQFARDRPLQSPADPLPDAAKHRLWRRQQLVMARLERRLGDGNAAAARLAALAQRLPADAEVIKAIAWNALFDNDPASAKALLGERLQATDVPSARVAAYIQLAYTDVLAGKLALARQAVDQARDLDPDQVEALALALQISSLKRPAGQRDDEHAQELTQALAERGVAPPGLPTDLTTLQSILKGNVAQYYFQIDVAIAAYTEATEREPKLAWPAMALATVYFVRHDFARAVPWFEKVALDPRYAVQAYVSIGRCRLALKDFTGAQTAFDAALERDAGYAPALRGRAFVINMRQIERRARELQAQQNQSPDNVPAPASAPAPAPETPNGSSPAPAPGTPDGAPASPSDSPGTPGTAGRSPATPGATESMPAPNRPASPPLAAEPPPTGT